MNPVAQFLIWYCTFSAAIIVGLALYIRRYDKTHPPSVDGAAEAIAPYTVTIPIDGDQLAIDREFHEIIRRGWR